MDTICLRLLRTFLVIPLFCLLANVVYAETYDVTGSVDIFGGYSEDTYGPINPSEVTFAVGDTVNLFYMFKDGRKLRLVDVEDGSSSVARASAWLGFVGTPCGEITECGDFTVSNWSINLIDARSKSGSAPESFSGLSQGSCCNHLGTDGNFNLGDGDFIEFSGISTSFTIDSLPADPNTYNAIRTRFFADEIIVVTPTSVAVDINPGKQMRCQNARKVVIQGGTNVDVTLIDTNTLRFGEDGGNNRIPRCRSDYVDADAYLDLICKFVPGTAESVLTGSLVDGSSIRGFDTICGVN